MKRMTRLRSILDRKVWRMMNENRYTHIIILGTLMFIAQFIFPTMLEPGYGQDDMLGLILYNSIAILMTLLTAILGWRACSIVINEGERAGNI